MGTEAEEIRIVDKDELVEKGEEIYAKVKDKLEPEHKGEIVAIEVKTGDYFLGNSVVEADRKARTNYPDAVFHLARIGYKAVCTSGEGKEMNGYIDEYGYPKVSVTVERLSIDAVIL